MQQHKSDRNLLPISPAELIFHVSLLTYGGCLWNPYDTDCQSLQHHHIEKPMHNDSIHNICLSKLHYHYYFFLSKLLSQSVSSGAKYAVSHYIKAFTRTGGLLLNVDCSAKLGSWAVLLYNPVLWFYCTKQCKLPIHCKNCEYRLLKKIVATKW